MWPTLLKIPWIDVAVPTFGVMVACGVVSGLALTNRVAARDGIDSERFFRTSLLTVVATLAGTRVLDVVTGSGLVFYGSLVGGSAAAAVVARTSGVDLRKALDAGAPGLALGQAIGRVGCFAAGCCWGTVCHHAWGVTYPLATTGQTGAPVLLPLHPVQLYEAAVALALSAALVRLHARRAFPGQVVLAYLVAYGTARFLLEFLRGDDRGDLFGLSAASGLSPAQLVSLALVAVAIPLWLGRFAWREAAVR